MLGGFVSLAVVIALTGATAGSEWTAVEPAGNTGNGQSTTGSEAIVEWYAPRGCPSYVQVKRRLTELLAPRGGATVSVRTIARVRYLGPKRWRLELVLQTSHGERTRTIEAETCTAAADATAMVTAIAAAPSVNVTADTTDGEPLGGRKGSAGEGSGGRAAGSRATVGAAKDSDGKSRGSARDKRRRRSGAERSGDDYDADGVEDADQQRDEPTIPTREDPRPVGAVKANRRRPSRRPSPLHGQLRLHGGALATPKPLFAPMLGGSLGLMWPRFGLQLGGMYSLPVVAGQQEPTARLQTMVGTLRAGPVFALRRISLLLSAGAEAGGIYGSGVGLTERKTDWLPWLVAVGQLAIDVPISNRVAIWGALDAWAGLLRPTFTYTVLTEGDDLDSGRDYNLWRMPAAGGRVVLGLAVRIW